MFVRVSYFFLVAILTSTSFEPSISSGQEWEKISNVVVNGQARGIYHVGQSGVMVVRAVSQTFVLSSDTLESISHIPIGFSQIYVNKESEIILGKKTDVVTIGNSRQALSTFLKFEPKTGKIRGFVGPLVGSSKAAISPNGDTVLVLSHSGIVQEFSGLKSELISKIEPREHSYPLRIIYSECGQFAAIQWSKDIHDVPLDQIKNLDYSFTVIDLVKKTQSDFLGEGELESNPECNFDFGLEERRLPSSGANDLDEMLIENVWVADGIRFEKRMYTIERTGSVRMWRNKQD